MKSMRWSRIPNIDLNPVFPALCGAEDPEENQPAGSGAAAGENKGTEPTDGGDPQKKIKALEEEKDRHFNQAKEAKDKLAQTAGELEELRKFKQEQDDAKLSAEEKSQKEVQGLTAERDAANQKVESLQKAMQELVLQQAFITGGGVKWHDPEIALSKADLSSVEIEVNDKGIPVVKNPAALQKAAKALAESKAFLVDNGTKQEDKPWKASGPANAAARKTGTAADEEKAKLRRKYPTLQR